MACRRRRPSTRLLSITPKRPARDVSEASRFRPPGVARPHLYSGLEGLQHELSLDTSPPEVSQQVLSRWCAALVYWHLAFAIHPPTTPIREWFFASTAASDIRRLVCLLPSGVCIRAQPQSDVGGLHRLPHHL